MRVQWDRLDPATCEQLIVVLLSNLHPDLLRIDGKGGDGGRDAQFGPREAPRLFEIKSFTGRIAGGRRAQVERSLEHARSLSPSGWSLVVPIDHTPGELAWFDALRQAVPFPIEWRGLTWLEARLAEHPQVVRYFLEGGDAEVVAALKTLATETALMSTAEDAISRIERLSGQLNRIDPFFRYEIVHGRLASTAQSHGIMSYWHGETRIDVHERYTGALRDHPIKVGAAFAFGPHDEKLRQAFLRSVHYGTRATLTGSVVPRVTIEAPAGMGGTFSEVEIEIGPSVPSEVVEIDASLELLSDGSLLTSWPITLKAESLGQRGGTYRGIDSTGWLEVKGTFDHVNRQFSMSFSVRVIPILPAAALPFLRWLRNACAPHYLRMRFSAVGEPTQLENEPLVDARFLDFVEALADLQQWSGVYFPLPEESNDSEVEAVIAAQRLLCGEEVTGTWTSVCFEAVQLPDSNLAVLVEHDNHAMLFEASESLEVAGHRIPIGRVRTQYSSARLVDPDRFHAWLKCGDGTLTAEMQPGQNNRCVRRIAPS